MHGVVSGVGGDTIVAVLTAQEVITVFAVDRFVAGAGIAATFNAPLGGLVFALGTLMGLMSPVEPTDEPDHFPASIPLTT